MTVSKYFKIFAYILGVVILEAITLTRIKESYTDPVPYVCWAAMLFLLAKVVREDAVGSVNAIWCGLSVVLVTLYAAWAISEKHTFWTYFGMGVVIVGVALIELFKSST
jgi:small multidrug resistance pump